jgi:hypothetical protein
MDTTMSRPITTMPGEIDISTTIETPSGPTPEASFTFMDFLRYLLIIFILAFLGFNIFTYLGKATDETTDFLGPIIKSITGFFGKVSGETIKQTADVSAKGAKLGVDVAEGTVKSGIDVLEESVKELDGKKTDGPVEVEVGEEEEEEVGKVTTNGQKKEQQKKQKKSDTPDVPQPDDATSKTQISKPSGKSGYCYIGEDRGTRTCMHIGESDVCMSGQIFPSMEICQNPTLRV